MSDNISLSISSRSNLLSLQNTSDLISNTQSKLATGLKVNSALDDAQAYFKSQSLSNRASDLSTIKGSITQAVNVVQAATDALNSISSVLNQMKAIAQSAQASSDTGVRQTYASQFNSLRSQIDTLTQDASYNGVNLLKSSPDSLTVTFNETGTNTLQIVGLAATPMAGTLGITLGSADTTTTASTGWAASVTSGNLTLTSAITFINSALSTVRTDSQTFGTNAAMLNIRSQFTSSLVNNLQGGSAQLVNADMNQESANMLALQTRQSLGTISLNIANQSQQAILRLFG